MPRELGRRKRLGGLMLKQGAVGQLRDGSLSRREGYLVITMCYYPRGVHREWRDEFRSDLAPDRELLRDFRHFVPIAGHDAAFARSRYQARFRLSPEAFVHLRDLSELSRSRPVYLICQCALGERCHREILLQIAESLFGARIGKTFHPYRQAVRRLEAMYGNFRKKGA